MTSPAAEHAAAASSVPCAAWARHAPRAPRPSPSHQTSPRESPPKRARSRPARRARCQRAHQ